MWNMCTQSQLQFSQPDKYVIPGEEQGKENEGRVETTLSSS